MTKTEVKELLDEKYSAYCTPDFISTDPISIPHLFEDRADREISGLLAATLAWGQRPTILRNAKSAMHRMGYEPYRFVMEHSENDLRLLDRFVHRTFNDQDLKQFVRSLRHLYNQHDSLEDVFLAGIGSEDENLAPAIHHFRKDFFSVPHLERTKKHVADPLKGSAAKRINMYLRWMVRPNNRGVDFGLWTRISTAMLSCPLDVHSGRNARDLGLLHRKQNDHLAVIELDDALRSLHPDDPVRYDYALYGLGIYG